MFFAKLGKIHKFGALTAIINHQPTMKKISGIKNYFLEVPMPLGLPKVIAKRLFPIVQKLGISARKEVKSFDQVLYFTGNIDYKYLKHSVENIRKAIKDFKPDVVYSEFNVNKHNPTLQIYKSLGFTTIRAEKIDIGGGFYMDDYVERLEV